MLTTAHILAYPCSDCRFILDTDASDVGIGAVLSQIQDGEEQVLAYGSKAVRQSGVSLLYNKKRTVGSGVLYEPV